MTEFEMCLREWIRDNRRLQQKNEYHQRPGDYSCLKRPCNMLIKPRRLQKMGKVMTTTTKAYEREDLEGPDGN